MDDTPVGQNLPKTRHAVKISFEKIAREWDRLREKPWPDLKDFLEQRQYLNLFTNGYLLDLGCGNGRHTLMFSAKASQIVGVDFSSSILKIANEKRNLEGINNVSFVMADSTSLPFRNNTFSCIFILATLHNIPMQENRLNTVQQIKKILVDGGSCLITVWRRWQKRFFWHFLKQTFYQLVTLKSFREFGDIFIPWKTQTDEVVQRFYHLFSRREIKKLIRKVDLKVMILKDFGGPTKKDNIFVLLKKLNR